MKNFIKSNVFGFMLGVILCGGIVYGVNTYQSNSIEYSPTDSSWNVNNVNEAINSLYSMKNELDTTKTSLNNLKGIGDAVAGNILSGKTAVVKGSTITGTMTDRGAVTSTLNAGGSYTIPAGYHNGSGKVTVNTLESQTSATATAADIATGKTAWVNGSKLTGTMKQGSGAPILLASGLSSGATVNCTSIPNYQNLTASNFMLVITKMKATSSNAYMDHTKTVGSPSYNASTGVLTLPTLHWNGMSGDSNNVRLYVNVYVAY